MIPKQMTAEEYHERRILDMLKHAHPYDPRWRYMQPRKTQVQLHEEVLRALVEHRKAKISIEGGTNLYVYVEHGRARWVYRRCSDGDSREYRLGLYSNERSGKDERSGEDVCTLKIAIQKARALDVYIDWHRDMDSLSALRAQREYQAACCARAVGYHLTPDEHGALLAMAKGQGDDDDSLRARERRAQRAEAEALFRAPAIVDHDTGAKLMVDDTPEHVANAREDEAERKHHDQEAAEASAVLREHDAAPDGPVQEPLLDPDGYKVQTYDAGEDWPRKHPRWSRDDSAMHIEVDYLDDDEGSAGKRQVETEYNFDAR